MSTLVQAEANLFFKLMWAVQFYVNQQLKLVPGVKTREEYQKLPQEDKLKVREALYQQIDRLDSFIAENPASLSPEELEIVRGWKGSSKVRPLPCSRAAPNWPRLPTATPVTWMSSISWPIGRNAP